MPMKITQNRMKEFINNLEDFGGSSGNARLREKLDWEEEFYWRVQGKLVEDGKIVPGRGRGGSVRLTVAETEQSRDISQISPDQDAHAVDVGKNNTIGPVRENKSAVIRRADERKLYAPICRTMELTWIKRFGFDEVSIEETHSRGSKHTGGTFTRPDITVIGLRQYVFLPKRIEVVTFEIKTEETTGILGVLEAIAHRESAHRAYVIYPISRINFDNSAEAERIIELSQKYGIGIVLAEETDNVETWEIVSEAVRHEPDPARLDRFLGDLPSDSLKNQLHKWRI